MSDEFMKIKELLEKKTGRKAVIKKMVKNNGSSYTGIFVEFESTNTLPVINLDAFYDMQPSTTTILSFFLLNGTNLVRRQVPLEMNRCTDILHPNRIVE